MPSWLYLSAFVYFFLSPYSSPMNGQIADAYVRLDPTVYTLRKPYESSGLWQLILNIAFNGLWAVPDCQGIIVLLTDESGKHKVVWAMNKCGQETRSHSRLTCFSPCGSFGSLSLKNLPTCTDEIDFRLHWMTVMSFQHEEYIPTEWEQSLGLCNCSWVSISRLEPVLSTESQERAACRSCEGM